MISKIKILRCDFDLIQGELEANSPYEACGVLVGTINGDTAVVEKAIPITNSNRTARSFELEPGEFYNAWNNAGKSGKEIVGVYHTHPRSSAVPSLWDRETMQNDPGVWLIAGSDGVKAYVWDDGVRAVKIVGF
ncbi:MAG: M67 family metallopeptidase [Candidatus Methanoperedenaceae archaeon]|nr:M67 family metallopeptidase [Candidatus Methanoperedenaceae archaeon]MDW7725516.1 M67 family metallopeptidase [Candidatus Methanoperedens sp.]